MYCLILGCNEASYEIAERLVEAGGEVAIVDPNPKISEIREIRTIVGDFLEVETLKKAKIEEANVILISTLQVEKTLEVLSVIKRLKEEQRISPIVLVFVPDQMLESEMKSMGASGVIPISKTLGEVAFREFERAREGEKERELRELFRELRGRMLIVTHINPDPDSIASAMALKTYAKYVAGIDADIAYDGEMAFAQNRAMCNLLNIELKRITEVNLRSYQIFSLVDASARAYHPLPPEITPTIVIDHHPVPASEVTGRFVEIAPVKACSTVFANYLEHAGIPATGPLASALILGILTDTANLSTATPVDLEAYWRLREKHDANILRAMMSPVYSYKVLHALGVALKKLKSYGSVLVSHIGEVEDEDTVSQVADFLLSAEGVVTVIVSGVVRNKLRFSGRTKESSIHLGKVFSEVFRGEGGGHQDMAGARVNYVSQSQVSSFVRKLLKELGIKVHAKRTTKSL